MEAGLIVRLSVNERVAIGAATKSGEGFARWMVHKRPQPLSIGSDLIEICFCVTRMSSERKGREFE